MESAVIISSAFAQSTGGGDTGGLLGFLPIILMFGLSTIYLDLRSL